MWEAPSAGRCVHEKVAPPAMPATIEARYCHVTFRSTHNHYRFSQQVFPADTLPISNTDLGPGSLALFCGSTPIFDENTVWFWPNIEEVTEPETLPPLRFDEQNSWWQTTMTLIEACAKLSRDKYLVGCPDLIERDAEEFLKRLPDSVMY
ncbi:trimethylamine corrinoid protein 2 [Candidatus Moduliflexus flocculans]|uniref:Trimethylamine corrinoid protein 2 n=1 Tax=Candidatus Moduliflexus flocculans TaxID=1499966 RepID=A0A081BSQ6_9BACT|nr:trimethylamine corrinoid protein 2 [Candidatus Moduliflexus flocculans]